MQFCWSTSQSNSPQYSATDQFLLSQACNLTSSSKPLFFYYFNSCYSQFLALSQTLNQELVLNNSLIEQIVQPTIETAEAQETGISDSQGNHLDLKKNTTQELGIKVEAQEQKNQNQKIKRRGNRYNNSDQDSYVPEEVLSKNVGLTTGRQSKNIPKNYGKAIIIFIQKNEDYVSSVLTKLKLNFVDFMKSVKKIKQKLKSVRELKSLWMQEANQFAKAYRIISNEYLRKHCLSHIFNSRVAKITNHIKYRYRIIDIVKNPKAFTVLKEF